MFAKTKKTSNFHCTPFAWAAAAAGTADGSCCCVSWWQLLLCQLMTAAAVPAHDCCFVSWWQLLLCQLMTAVSVPADDYRLDCIKWEKNIQYYLLFTSYFMFLSEPQFSEILNICKCAPSQIISIYFICKVDQHNI